MGRFYESTAANFVDDKMFQAPHQLMAQAMMNKDAQIDKQVEKVEAYDPLLQIKGLDADTARGRQLIAEYHSKIDDIVSGITKNPLEYNNYSRGIRELGRNIKDEWGSGEAFNINNNKMLYDKEIAEIDKLDPKTYEAAYKEREKAHLVENYTKSGGIAWNKALGKAGNSLDIASAYHPLDLNDDNFRQYMEASGYSSEKESSGGNGYIYSKTRGGEGLNAEQLVKAKYDYMKANPALQDAIKRRGEINQDGYVGANIETALTYDKKGKMVISDDYYGRNLQSAKRFAFNKTVNKDGLSADSTYMTMWSRAQDKADKDAEAKGEMMSAPVVEAKARTKEQTAALNELYYNTLSSTAVAAGMPKGIVYKNYTQVNNEVNHLEKVANSQKDPKIRKASLERVVALRQGMKNAHDSWRGNSTEASYATFGSAYGVKAAVSAQKQMNALTTADTRNVYDKRMDFRFKNEKGVDVVYHNIPFYTIYKDPAKFGLNKDAFDLIDPVSKLSKGKKPIKEFYVQNSAMPVMISGDKWELNDMTLEFEVNGQSMQGQTSFKELGLKEVR